MGQEARARWRGSPQQQRGPGGTGARRKALLTLRVFSMLTSQPSKRRTWAIRTSWSATAWYARSLPARKASHCCLPGFHSVMKVPAEGQRRGPAWAPPSDRRRWPCGACASSVPVTGCESDPWGRAQPRPDAGQGWRGQPPPLCVHASILHLGHRWLPCCLRRLPSQQQFTSDPRPTKLERVTVLFSRPARQGGSQVKLAGSRAPALTSLSHLTGTLRCLAGPETRPWPLPSTQTPCLWAALVQPTGGTVTMWWLKYTKMSTYCQW